MKEKTLLKLEKEKLIAKLQILQQKKTDEFNKENNPSERTLHKDTQMEMKTRVPKNIDNPYENDQEEDL